MTTRRKPDGGFRLIGAHELLWVYSAFRAEIIRWYDVRVWFACHEAVARRCAVKKGVPVRYRKEEIDGLVGGAGGGHVRGALKRLEAAGLIRWAPENIIFGKSQHDVRPADLNPFSTMVEALGRADRKVPVPRRTIRLIASGARKVVTATMLGHLLRCCYLRKSEYSAEGSCSAAWVASVFGLDERNVKIGRKHLVSIGWLMPLQADAWHRQRYGARWEVNPAWLANRQTGQRVNSVGKQRRMPTPNRSPRIPDLDSKRSPLLILKENSFGSKNQKLASAADRPPGVCKPESVSSGPPTLKHVVIEDLRETTRTLRLFEQAADAGFVRRCEADRLKVVAAAERALRTASRNPCGLFATLVRRRLWHHITLGEEDGARQRLKQAAARGLLFPVVGGGTYEACQETSGRGEASGTLVVPAGGDAAASRAKIRALVERSLASLHRAQFIGEENVEVPGRAKKPGVRTKAEPGHPQLAAA